MAIDLNEYARSLRVIDLTVPNETGYITPPVLYEPHLGRAPAYQTPKYWIFHGTVGWDSLPHFCNRANKQAGSVTAGLWTCIPYLIPRDTTTIGGRVWDTRRVVFKLIPDNRSCNHVGPATWKGDPVVSNGECRGAEYENWQGFKPDNFTLDQMIKGALIHAHDAAAMKIPDLRALDHGIVRTPFGERTDPWAGDFDKALHWEIVADIRRDPRIWDFWNLIPWVGRVIAYP